MPFDNRPTAALECPNCGTAFEPIRRNQRCCSKACRAEYQARQRQISRQQPKPKRNCAWCGEAFTPAAHHQDYCTTEHKRADEAFFRAWGPKVLKLVFRWRYHGRRFSLAHVCQDISKAWAERERLRKAARDD